MMVRLDVQLGVPVHGRCTVRRHFHDGHLWELRRAFQGRMRGRDDAAVHVHLWILLQLVEQDAAFHGREPGRQQTFREWSDQVLPRPVAELWGLAAVGIVRRVGHV